MIFQKDWNDWTRKIEIVTCKRKVLDEEDRFKWIWITSREIVPWIITVSFALLNTLCSSEIFRYQTQLLLLITRNLSACINIQRDIRPSSTKTTRAAAKFKVQKIYPVNFDDLTKFLWPRPEFPHFRDCWVHIEVILCLFHDWLLLYFYHRSFILVPKSLLWNYNYFNIFYEIDRNQCNIPILGLKFLVNHGSLKFFSFSQEVKKSMWIFCLTIIQCFHDIIFPSINWNPLQGIEIELKTF